MIQATWDDHIPGCWMECKNMETSKPFKDRCTPNSESRTLRSQSPNIYGILIDANGYQICIYIYTHIIIIIIVIIIIVIIIVLLLFIIIIYYIYIIIYQSCHTRAMYIYIVAAHQCTQIQPVEDPTTQKDLVHRKLLIRWPTCEVNK